MLKKWTLGLGAALLSLGGLGAVAWTSGQDAGQPRVICCGECKPGDDCLVKCKVEGKVPKDAKLTCCGKCEKGDNCLEKCSSKRDCCETK